MKRGKPSFFYAGDCAGRGKSRALLVNNIYMYADSLGSRTTIAFCTPFTRSTKTKAE